MTGRFLLVAFLGLPMYPGAITGWDTVSSWSPGCLVFLAEPFTMLVTVCDVIYMIEDTRANPDEYRGDGGASFYWESLVRLMRSSIFLAASVAMVLVAVRRWKHAAWRVLVSAVMVAGLCRLVWAMAYESQTYVNGAYHIGLGSYFWIAGCVVLLLTVNWRESVEDCQEDKP